MSNYSKSAADYISMHKMTAHPEGGFYKEIFRAKTNVETVRGERSSATSIYFLLEQGQISHLHRIAFEELWTYIDGGPLEIFMILDGRMTICVLDENNPICLIPPGVWFGSRPKTETAFCICTCTVAPGFDFEDFEMADYDRLSNEYPDISDLKDVCLS